VHGIPEKDIGQTSSSGANYAAAELESDEQKILDEMYKSVGGAQVMRHKMACAPPWLLDRAVEEELTNAWKGAYEEVPENAVPRNANVICSHIVYKIKLEEENHKRLKARLCPHGNRDQERGRIRSDASNATFDITRLTLSIAAIALFSIGCVDIKGTYLQSGPIQRDLYVRPPREWKGPRGVLWKLLKLPYGICEAGRQWAKTIEQWLVEQANFHRVYGVSQLYVRRGPEEEICLLLAKLTDDMLIAGNDRDIREFIAQIGHRFETRKSIIGSEISFNGCTITQSDSHTVLSMESYFASIRKINVSKGGLAQKREKATATEIAAYRRLAGELIWLGCGALPQPLVVGYLMQQHVSSLEVEHIHQANRSLRELRNLRPVVTFRRPIAPISSVEVVTFSDAAFNISPGHLYGQTGFGSGIRLRSTKGDPSTFHMIDWGSNKQRWVRYSSYDAEILACTDADDRGYGIKQALTSISPRDRFPHILHVNSRGLFDTITTLHEGREYRLRQTVQRIRDSFESGDLDSLRWVQGKANIADAMTKKDLQLSKVLNRMSCSGILELPNHRSLSLDSSTWT